MTYLQQELTKRGVLLPLPLHLQPLCLKSPCCPPAQAPHTNKYASITLPSLSTIFFHSLSSVGSTLADPDGHLGRALLSLWQGLWYKSPTPSLSYRYFSLMGDTNRKRLARADSPLLLTCAILQAPLVPMVLVYISIQSHV